MSIDTTAAPPARTWVYTIEETLQASKVSRTRLYAEINAGRLRVIKNGRRTLISEWALRAWLEGLERDARVGAPGVEAAAAASVAKRFGVPAQTGHARVVVLMLIALGSLAFALPDVVALLGPALAMVAPVGTARVLMPEHADEALAGERAALRVLRRIRDGIGHGDELLGELRDVVLDDGNNLPATPRLRAFLRTIQKRLEGRS